MAGPGRGAHQASCSCRARLIGLHSMKRLRLPPLILFFSR
jgi:hypothetical protein